MREIRSSGSVQGAMSDHGSYCDYFATAACARVVRSTTGDRAFSFRENKKYRRLRANFKGRVEWCSVTGPLRLRATFRGKAQERASRCAVRRTFRSGVSVAAVR
jgi:hypothetical protein